MGSVCLLGRYEMKVIDDIGTKCIKCIYKFPLNNCILLVVANKLKLTSVSNISIIIKRQNFRLNRVAISMTFFIIGSLNCAYYVHYYVQLLCTIIMYNYSTFHGKKYNLGGHQKCLFYILLFVNVGSKFFLDVGCVHTTIVSHIHA